MHVSTLVGVTVGPSSIEKDEKQAMRLLYSLFVFNPSANVECEVTGNFIAILPINYLSYTSKTMNCFAGPS